MLRNIPNQPAAEASPAPPVVPVLHSVGVVATFNMVNGLQRFVLAVPGVTVANPVWLSLDGETTPPASIAGVQGGWVSGPDEVTCSVFYPGASSSVDVPLRVFWQTPT